LGVGGLEGGLAFFTALGTSDVVRCLEGMLDVFFLTADRTAAWRIGEALLREELLLAAGPHKRRTALFANNFFVSEGHIYIMPQMERARIRPRMRARELGEDV